MYDDAHRASDRLHDHLTLGFRRGCLACAQLEADLARARAASLVSGNLKANSR